MIVLQEYIHRVGRTARGEGGSGKALLMLQPEELGFLMYLKKAKVQLNEFDFTWSKVANIQSQVHAVRCSFLMYRLENSPCFLEFPRQMIVISIKKNSRRGNFPEAFVSV